MEPEDNSLETGYSGSNYDSSLESNPTVAATSVSSSPSIGSGYGHSKLSPFHFNKTAFLVTGGALALILIIGVASFLFSSAQNNKKAALTGPKSGNYSVSSLPLSGVKGNSDLLVGQADNLEVNGQLEVSNTVVLTPTSAPSKATAGQIYYDKTTNQLYYYNGTAFVPVATQNAIVSSLGGLTGAINTGAGISGAGGTIQNTGVLSVQGQTGNVTFTAGGGVSISGTTISTTALPNGQLVLGTGASGFSSVAQASGVGQCLISTAGAPVFGTCPGGGAAVTSISDGVTSINGALTFSGTGVTINASGSTVSFNVASGGNVSASGTHIAGTLPVFTGVGQAIGDSLLVQTGSGASAVLTATADVTVAAGFNFNGDGSGLTALNAGSISTGTLAVARGGTGATSFTQYALTVAGTGGVLGSLGIGTSGQCLLSGGPGVNPAFTACPVGGNVSRSGTVSLNRLAKFDANNGNITDSSLLDQTTGLQVTASGYYFDLSNAGTSTLTVRNSNGSNVANLTVTGKITAVGGLLNGTDTFAIPTNSGNGGTLCFVLGVTSNCPTGGNISSGTAQTTGYLTRFDTTTNQITNSELLVQVGGLQYAGTGYLLDLNSGSNSTLTVDNAGAGVANLSVSGSVTATGGLVLASGKTIAASGGGIAINAGTGVTDNITFMNANGANSFLFPTTGGLGQTICTSGITCASGGGQAVILEPGTGAGTAQTSAANRPSIWINRTGGTGNLLQLQAGGSDRFALNSVGEITAMRFAAGVAGTDYVTLLSAAQTGIVNLSVPTVAAGNYNVCLSIGNCASSGGGITGIGTNGRIAKFTSSGTIGNSILTEAGSNVSVAGTLTATGASSLTLGTASSNTGAIIFQNSANGNTLTLQSGATGGNLTFTLPTADGGANQCIKTNASGVLSFGDCLSGSGGGGGVTQLNGFSGSVTIAGTTNQINVVNSSGTITLSTPQDIHSGASPTFSALTLTAGTTGLTVSGAPTNSATSSLIRIGNAIAGGDISVNGGTYIGLNSPASGAGSVADFLNFQSNGTSRLRVTNAGALTAAGTITLSSLGAGLVQSSAGGVLSSSAVDRNSSTFFNTALSVANGGTGATTLTTNGVLFGQSTGAILATAQPAAGQVLLGNATGVPTFTTISSDLAISGTGVATIQANAVALSTDTTGDYVANLGALTGLTTSGNSGEGSTPTLSVTYGSSASTAVQGNTALTCPSGAGNLTGGGTVITLGTGGTCSAIDTVASPTFTGNVTVQGGSGTFGTGTQAGSIVLYDNGIGSETVTLTTGDITSSYSLTLPTAVGSTNQCLKAQDGIGTLFWNACDGGAGGSSATLQSAYVAGNTITTAAYSAGRNIDITLANTATDSHLIVNVATGSDGELKVQNNGTDVLQIGLAGQLQLDVQGSTGGLLIGTDATLYRSSATAFTTNSSLSIQKQVNTALEVRQSPGGFVVFDINSNSPGLNLGGWYNSFGNKPSSVATNGTAAIRQMNVVGGSGGDTSGTTGQVAGTGSDFLFQGGVGGNAPSGSTNGNGGDITLQVGAPGSGAGAVGNYGVINLSGAVLAKNLANSTTAFQIQNVAGNSNLFIADTTNSRVGLGVVPITTAGSGLLQVGASGATTAAQGISFGGDTVANLYRTAAGVISTDGDINVQGGDLVTNQTTFNLINTTATTLNIGGAATTALNLGPGGATATSVNLAGGSGATGCTVDGATGNLACSGNITGAAAGTVGYWTRSGTTLQPATAGDAVTVTGLVTANGGLTVTGGAANINATGSNTVNIGNTSAGAIAIQSGSTVALISGTTLSLTSTGSNAINITPGGGTNTGVLIRPTADSINAFQIQKGSDSSVLFRADTTNMTVTVGSVSPAATFASKVDLNAGTSFQFIQGAALGDFNADGKLDAITTNISASTAPVFINTGSALPTSPNYSLTSTSSAASATVGDFNGDGKADAAIVNNAANTVSIYINTGTALPTSATYTLTGLSGPRRAVAGDFNNDGKTDLAVTNQSGNNIFVFTNTGTALPTTVSSTLSTASATGPYGLAIGDFNADGKTDLIVANNGSSNATVYINTGSALPTSGTNVTAGSGPRQVAVGDFNNDSRPDAVVINATGGDATAFINTGTALPGTGTTLTTVSNPDNVTVGDFNGDGYVDAAVGSSTSGISIQNGSSTGLSTTVSATVSTGLTHWDIASGDISGDGRIDLFTTNNSYNTASYILNTSASLAVNGQTVLGKVVTQGGLQVQGAAQFQNSLTLQNMVDTTSALRVQNTAGLSLLNADTVNMRISVGSRGTVAGQLYVGGLSPTSAFGSANGHSASTGIAVQGRYAYLVPGNGTNGYLQVYDISNPASPTLLNSTNTATTFNNAKKIRVQGKYAYVAGGGTFQVFDISNPLSPTSVATQAYTGSTNNQSLYVQGKYAYVGESATQALYIFDISNPTSVPNEVTLSSGFASASAGASDIYAQGRYVYVANTGTNPFQIIDMSNPAAPTVVSSITSGTITGVARSITVQGRYAYVGTLTNGSGGELFVIDVSNPSSPSNVIAGGIELGSAAHNLSAQSRYLYAADNAGVIRTLDISIPASTNLLSGTVTAASPQAIQAVGRYVYASNNTGTPLLSVYDMGGAYIQSVETGTIETDTFSARGNANFSNDVAIQGSLAVGTNLQVTGSTAIVTSNTAALQVQDTSGNTIFNADSTNRRVGVGITAPTATLHVAGYQPSSASGGAGTNADSALIVTGGNGGNSTYVGSTVAGGTGGGISLASGTGGNNTSITPSCSLFCVAGNGGLGGNFALAAGAGGNGYAIDPGFGSTGAVGGAGGSLALTGGAGGTGFTNGTGGSITLQAGSAGGASATAGSINIQSGATGVAGAINIGSGGVANTIQIGSLTGAVAQSINIGTNAVAGSTNTVTIGSTVGTGVTTVQSATTTGSTLTVTANSLTTGKALNVTSSSTGLTSGTLLTVAETISYTGAPTLSGSLGNFTRSITSAVTTVTLDSSSSSTGVGTTWTHTLGTGAGTNRALYVTAGTHAGSTPTVTYNSTSMNAIHSSTNGSVIAYIFELKDALLPGAAGGYTVVVTNGDSNGIHGAVSYTNVNQTTSTENAVTSTTSDLAVSNTSGNYAVDSIGSSCYAFSPPLSPGSSGQIEFTNSAGQASNSKGSYNATATTANFSWAGSGCVLAHAGLSVRKAATAVAITGAVANFSSNCTVSAGSCTDSASILNLQQSFATASGAVLNLQNAGTGAAIALTQTGSSTVDLQLSSVGVIQTAGGSSTTAVTLQSGNASTTTSGALTLRSGTSVTGSGNVTLASGTASGSGNTGTVSVQSGNATSGVSGALTVSTGTGTTSTGAITLSTGNSSTAAGTSGAITLSTGTTNAGTGGVININPNGASNTGVVVKPLNNSTTAFQIQNAAGTSNLLVADTTNTRIGIGIGVPLAQLHVSGAGGGTALFRVTDTTATARDVLNIADGGAVTLRNQADSTAAFQVQNAAGTNNLLSIDTSNTVITLNTANSPALSTFTANTSMGTPRFEHTSVVANGFVYAIAGFTTGFTTIATTEYAKINADGTLGTWTATTSVGTARDSHSTVVANGYVYAIGGLSSATTEYAKINADGTLGTWTATTSMGAARGGHTSVVANGYVYAIGGPTATTEYARLNANGTLGTWTATTSMGTARLNHISVVANGYVYATSGTDGVGGTFATTEYARLNANGTLGTWTATSSLGTASQGATSAMVNGYVYAMGGANSASAVVSSTEYASTARLRVAGAVDLVGLSGANLAEGETGSGGELTSGNTRIVGSLDVQGPTSFSRNVSIGGTLSVSDQALFKNNTNSTTAFQIQNAAGTSNLLVADTTNTRIGIGIGVPLAQLHVSGAGGGTALFRVTDTTATARDVLNIADGGAVTLRNQADSTAAFQVQNATSQTLLVADTTNQRLAFGPAAAAANSIVTVGTNTTASTGGITFGTDSFAYRSAAGVVRLGSSAQNVGIGEISSGLPGLQFGSDVLLYRAAADTLKTDDSLEVRTSTDGTSAFSVRNTVNTILLEVDTTNTEIDLNAEIIFSNTANVSFAPQIVTANSIVTNTITPASTYVFLKCDPGAATTAPLTLSETGARAGQILIITVSDVTNDNDGDCSIADSAGVQQVTILANLNDLDNITFIYDGTQWLQLATTDL